MSEQGRVYLGADLGASSGRVLAGVFDGRRLSLEEVHRFGNGPVTLNDRMYWDVLGLWEQIQRGLGLAAQTYGNRVHSIGVDTWGVDYVLLGSGDEFLGNPYHYRDTRTRGKLEEAFKLVPREEIFAETGLQFMELNTLYQILAMKQTNPALLDAAQSFLMIPDMFHWLLTGEMGNEQTNASTTQFYNPNSGDWSQELLSKFDIPTHFLNEIIPPGAELGGLRGSLEERTGLRDVRVILPGTHDTASAVMAVPATSAPSNQPDWCYISSGTWSLMGIETPDPIITDRCRKLNFTNEGGVGGTTRVLKNIGGLWLVQECRRIWSEAGLNLDWADLVTKAQQAAPRAAHVNPDHGSLLAPANMPEAIREFCRTTGQAIPDSEGAIIRCALESLALRYRMVLGWLEELSGQRIEVIHIVGGGTQNQLLCQMTADACNRRVVAGPVEATALGNLMMQVVASGEVASIQEARQIIKESFDAQEYEPQDAELWSEAYVRFEQLVEAE